MTNVISCKNLSFSYGQTPILQNVSFHISKGEYVAIFGPNGGGKTTLLKLIMGFLTPQNGTISILGRSPEEVHAEIAYVPQKLKFDPKFPISVMEVVQMGQLDRLTFWGRFRKGSREKALEALQQVGLHNYASRSFGTLSGGETQRVLIARALVSNPKLLLLDEPIASVDSAGEKEIYNILKSLKKKMTILMVTHHLSGAIEEVDRAFCVQRDVLCLNKQDLCGHFAIGLYHPPLEGGSL